MIYSKTDLMMSCDGEDCSERFKSDAKGAMEAEKQARDAGWISFANMNSYQTESETQEHYCPECK
jgi:hypothetical protein